MTLPTGRCTQLMLAPKFYDVPKILKQTLPNTHLSSRGSITYGMAKELAGIMHPLVGQSPHQLRNTQHFVQQIQQTKLEQGEVMESFDVKALFTSVPVHPSIQIVQQRLQQDSTLPNRNNMSIPHIISLLEFYLKTHTSSSRVTIMNRYMVQPWVPLSAPSLPTCLWKSLRSKPLALPPTLTPHLAKVCG